MKRKVFIGVLCFHICLLGIGCYNSFFVVRKLPLRPLVVHTVQLQQPRPQVTVSHSSEKKVQSTPVKKSKKQTKEKYTKKDKEPQTSPNGAYNQTLVAQALQELNKTHIQRAPKGLSSVRSAPVLRREKDLPSSSQSKKSPESYYIADLVRKLQLQLWLAEPGEARIQITLTRQGTIHSIKIVSCENSMIRKPLLHQLKVVRFSPFGAAFRGEETHLFQVRLSHDLLWSCS